VSAVIPSLFGFLISFGFTLFFSSFLIPFFSLFSTGFFFFFSYYYTLENITELREKADNYSVSFKKSEKFTVSVVRVKSCKDVYSVSFIVCVLIVQNE